MNQQPFPKRAVAICSKLLANYPPKTILFVCAALQLLAASCHAFVYYSHNSFTSLDWAFVFSPVGYFCLGLVARTRPLLCLYGGLAVSGVLLENSDRHSQFPQIFFDGQLLALAVSLLLGLGLLNEAYRQRNAFNRYQELFRATAFTIIALIMGVAFFFINSHVNEIANQMTKWQTFKIGTRGFTGTQLTELFGSWIQELRFCQIALFGCVCLAPFFLLRAVVSYRQFFKSNAAKKGKATIPTQSSDGIEPIK